MKSSIRIFFRALFQDKIDMLRFGRPNPEVRLTRRDQFPSDRITAFSELCVFFSRLSTTLVLHESDFAFYPGIDH